MTGAPLADIRRVSPDREDFSRGDAAFDAAKAAEIERSQRQRFARIFGDGLFADPARDILLDLFVAEAAGTAVSMSGACAASGAPVATALRYMTQLEQAGLIRRHEEDGDGDDGNGDGDGDGAVRCDARIELTIRASTAMRAYFAGEPPTVPQQAGPR